MHVLYLTTTYNRNSCLERALRFFMEQTYTGKATMVVFNSGAPTRLDLPVLEDNKEIIYIERAVSLETKKLYASVGEKYNDLIRLSPKADIVCSADVDDIFLPNYIEDGVKGMTKAYSLSKLAFKPKKSFYKSTSEIVLMENVFEPSIFVDYSHIKTLGYHNNSVKYHDKWLLPLIQENKILVDEKFAPGFCYDWGGELPAYKMSGKGEDTQHNFDVSQKIQKDIGSGITSPISKELSDRIYKEISDAFEVNNQSVN